VTYDRSVAPPPSATVDTRPVSGRARKPVAPTGKRYLQLVLVLGSLIALGPLTIDMYLPAFPALRQDLAASESAVQLTLTGMLGGLAAGQLVIGPLSDAFGPGVRCWPAWLSMRSRRWRARWHRASTR
jgi:DHA1 family bicyclomycin/chloramphenicol resistance-like MFS transporter